MNLAHPAGDFNQALRIPGTAAALASLERAAAAGCQRAQLLLGLAYHTGRGVASDMQRATDWYMRASTGGDAYAMANLALLCLLQELPGADYLDAYLWTQSAVGLGQDWLRPVLPILERRISGQPDKPETAAQIAALRPHEPEYHTCTLPDCDLSRCTNA